MTTKQDLQKEIKTKEKDLKFYRETISFVLTTLLTDTQLDTLKEYMTRDKLKKIIYK